MRPEDEEKYQKLLLIQKIMAAKKARRNRDIHLFNPAHPEMIPFQKQIAYFSSKSRIKLARAGNRSGKTFTTTRELAWMITRTHPYNSQWNVPGGKWDEETYLRTPRKRFWVFGPDYEFTTQEMWKKYLCGFIPEWFYTDDEGNENVTFTNQRNVDKVTCRNGDIVEFRSYSQDIKSMMGASIDVVLIDEMPSNVMIITELLTRTFDVDGIMIMGFTPLNPVSEIKDFLEAHPKVETFSWSVKDNPHYRDNPERLGNVLATWGQMSDHELESRLNGGWYFEAKGGYIFAGLEIETVKDFPIPGHWRRARVADPSAHITGLCQFAEDPATNVWYCYDSSELKWGKVLARAEDIVKEIEKKAPYKGFPWTLSIYDNSAGFFGAYAREVKFRPSIYKNRDHAIMMTKTLVGNKQVVFFAHGASGVVRQLREYRFRENGAVRKYDDHMLDCLMYFSREVPLPQKISSARPQDESDWLFQEYVRRQEILAGSAPAAKTALTRGFVPGGLAGFRQCINRRQTR